jgi:hypothetical protein
MKYTFERSSLSVLTMLTVTVGIITLMQPSPGFAQWNGALKVDASVADDTGDGKEWASAHKNLATALTSVWLDDVGFSNQIWIAQGTYSDYFDGITNAFVITNNNLMLLGGFTNGMTSTNQRDYTNRGLNQICRN